MSALQVAHRTSDQPGVLTVRHSKEIDPNYTSKIRELVNQTIQELQTSEKCDAKTSLKKLLKSLNCAPNSRDPVQAKNVKLIHVISTDPIPEEIPEEIIEEAKDNAEVTTKRKSIFQPVSSSGGGPHSSNKRNITVPEELSNLILQYKRMLVEYRRTNVMYKKGIPVRPCELVHRYVTWFSHVTPPPLPRGPLLQLRCFSFFV